jgi:cell division protein FtsI/penicillin-binding protein 2
MRKKSAFDNFMKKVDEYPRINIIFGLFILIFAITILKVFSYTVFEYDFYKNLANKQQI